MPCVVTDACGNCRTCLAVCPIDCFFEDVEAKRVYIHQSECIGCLCCYQVCPENAIVPAGVLPLELLHQVEVNRSLSEAPSSHRLKSRPLFRATPVAVQGRSAATAYQGQSTSGVSPDWWSKSPRKSSQNLRHLHSFAPIKQGD